MKKLECCCCFFIFNVFLYKKLGVKNILILRHGDMGRYRDKNERNDKV